MWKREEPEEARGRGASPATAFKVNLARALLSGDRYRRRPTRMRLPAADGSNAPQPCSVRCSLRPVINSDLSKSLLPACERVLLIVNNASCVPKLGWPSKEEVCISCAFRTGSADSVAGAIRMLCTSRLSAQRSACEDRGEISLALASVGAASWPLEDEMGWGLSLSIAG